MVRLGKLVERLGGDCAGIGAGTSGPEVRDVWLDSRRVTPESLFAALRGHAADGTRFVPSAIDRGAVAILAEEAASGLQPLPVPLWVHPQARRVAGQAASLVYGEPARDMTVIAVTGTNGKTSVAHLVGALLERVGRRPAVFGTAGHRLAGGVSLPASHTTPDAPELFRLIARHRELGGDSVVLEASSHALDQARLAGLEVQVAVFTNLSRDHLDYHGDMESYAAAKERLFHELPRGASAVVKADDPWAPRMMAAARSRGAEVVTYSAGSRADLRATRIRVFPDGALLHLAGMGIPEAEHRIPLVGRHNVENALAALAAVLQSGASPSSALEGLATVSPPPGRLEEVPCDRGFSVLVDYAHTPDALERVLHCVRETLDPQATGSARLILVFGCGGERDAGKRAPMGRIAGELADLCFLTSDNPRGEDPEAILQDVLAGMDGARGCLEVEADRRRAIAMALEAALPGDVVLIAGKGHEAVQEIAGERLPFDDRAVVRELIA